MTQKGCSLEQGPNCFFLSSVNPSENFTNSKMTINNALNKYKSQIAKTKKKNTNEHGSNINLDQKMELRLLLTFESYDQLTKEKDIYMPEELNTEYEKGNIHLKFKGKLRLTQKNQIKKDIIERLIPRLLEKYPQYQQYFHDEIIYHINPTGVFIIGGPHGDTGLTGRKIIVDTYGGKGAHGGGAFSGKDASKVDRSAAYMLRHIAKNIVANGYAKKCEIQVAYAIGMKEPLSICVNTFGTSEKTEEELVKIIKDKFDLTPNGIIEYLGLKEPIYTRTTNYGHFGKENLPWEKIIKI